jgi:hypothetical protein
MILRVAVYALSQAAALGGQIGAAGSFDASMLFSQIPTALVLLLMLAVVVTKDPRRRLWLYQCLSGTSSQSQQAGDLPLLANQPAADFGDCSGSLAEFLNFVVIGSPIESAVWARFWLWG